MEQFAFLGGVVEGFYGRPWSHNQRLHLFAQLASLGLNTYFYAPKDDLNHRAIWRELYHENQLAQFRQLVEECERHGLNFIYGLSPGLDIRFSELEEVDRITARLDQLRKLGVRHFALLFDDLPGRMREEDRRAFSSVAAAQCHVTNAVFAAASAPDGTGRFLFCPTAYCDRMDHEQLGGPGYLDQVGQLLDPRIDILWTGPEIVSAEIPSESIERLSARLRRPPVLWDNLFANDYDLHRLHCGPYSGRPLDLRQRVRGILLNPNNEYPINFVPLRTLAAFLRCKGEWNPRAEYLAAMTDWLNCYETATQPLEMDDLILLADCFYLPHVEGPKAHQLLDTIGRLVMEPADKWGGEDEVFFALNHRIQATFERLTELRDRELFYAWSRHAWQWKELLLALSGELTRKKTGRGNIRQAIQPNWAAAPCGLLAKLERLMPMDTGCVTMAS
jgi:protein O-GlcNAcase/histone acetyltransferase